ncbi:MAG: substrate-binding domain-containing protein [bacterium]
MKRIAMLSVVALIGLSMALVCGCAKKKAGGGEAAIRVGYSTPALTNQFWNRVSNGLQEAGKKNGVEVLVADAQGDSGKQLSDVEDLIQKRVSAILISPWDTDTAASCIKKANKAGIPVIVVDIGTSGGEYAAFIVSDNKEGGRMAGRYIAEKLGGKGKAVHIQCQLGARNAQLRGEGFEEIMKEKGIAIVAKQPADSRRDLGMSVMENILQKNPDVNTIFAQNDEMALGALRAIETSGKKGIIVVGFDGNDDAIKAIKDGGMAASVGQQPEEMGKIALETALKVIKKEKVEKEIFVPVTLITKESLEGKK